MVSLVKDILNLLKMKIFEIFEKLKFIFLKLFRIHHCCNDKIDQRITLYPIKLFKLIHGFFKIFLIDVNVKFFTLNQHNIESSPDSSLVD